MKHDPVELSNRELEKVTGGAAPLIPVAVWKAGKLIAGALTAAAVVDAAKDFNCGMNEGLDHE